MQESAFLYIGLELMLALISQRIGKGLSEVREQILFVKFDLKFVFTAIKQCPISYDRSINYPMEMGNKIKWNDKLGSVLLISDNYC
ncbi:hypothetical protein OUZ56_021394 [Daphnia magna]|uniref:Uncharacterized protein n=1 Tax=Daphnia magna TaxID=35525 RepID=A0ABQ9ZHX1_9CRUS|nr:hypothetical protein OUZ56_021394 [Daphnia magna]